MNTAHKTLIKVFLAAALVGLVIGLGFSIALQPFTPAQAANPVALATAPTAKAEPSKTASSGDSLQAEATQYLMPVLQAAATSLHLTPQQLMAAALSGKSLAEVAKSQDVELAVVQSAVMASGKTQLDSLVKAKKLTQPQADKAYQTTGLWFAELATLNMSDVQRLSGLAGDSFYEPILQATAASLHLTEDQLEKQLEAGASLADIARAQGVDLQQVKSAGLASGKAQLDNLVKSGKLTQTQADLAYQTATIWVDELANWHKPAGQK